MQRNILYHTFRLLAKTELLPVGHLIVDFSLHLSANGILLALLLGIGMRIGYDIPHEEDNDNDKTADTSQSQKPAEEEKEENK